MRQLHMVLEGKGECNLPERYWKRGRVWLNATDSKPVIPHEGIVSSNLTASAKFVCSLEKPV